jgi:hypothetical protein
VIPPETSGVITSCWRNAVLGVFTGAPQDSGTFSWPKGHRPGDAPFYSVPLRNIRYSVRFVENEPARWRASDLKS